MALQQGMAAPASSTVGESTGRHRPAPVTAALQPTPPLRRATQLATDDPGTGCAARRLVRSTLEQWRLPDLVDDVALCVSELVGNVVAHASAGGQITISLRIRRGCLFLEVSDQDSGPLPLVERGVPGLGGEVGCPGPPGGPSEPEDLCTHGRGLQIVQLLSDQVCWAPRESGGKTVYVRFGTRARQ